MKVKIFTEGGQDIGLGHISRCSSLYDEVSSRGMLVDFIISGDISDVGLLSGRDIISKDWLKEDYLVKSISKEDYVIVDSYKANRKIYEIITKISKRALYIDDMGRLDYPEGIVVNPALDVSHINYPKVKKVTYLLGPKYIILRPAFVNVRRDSVQKKIKSVLITMGGTDIRNLVPLIVNEICLTYSDINFNIVMGDKSVEPNNIFKEGIGNIKFYRNLRAEDIKKLMLETDFAITATGQTIYELLATCTPFIPIQVIDNQKYTVLALLENNIIDKVLDWESGNLIEEIIEEIEKLKDQTYRKMVVNKYSYFIDGKGVKRIIDELMR